jgi:hypothetical protein
VEIDSSRDVSWTWLREQFDLVGKLRLIQDDLFTLGEVGKWGG